MLERRSLGRHTHMKSRECVAINGEEGVGRKIIVILVVMWRNVDTFTIRWPHDMLEAIEWESDATNDCSCVMTMQCDCLRASTMPFAWSSPCCLFGKFMHVWHQHKLTTLHCAGINDLQLVSDLYPITPHILHSHEDCCSTRYYARTGRRYCLCWYSPVSPLSLGCVESHTPYASMADI